MGVDVSRQHLPRAFTRGITGAAPEGMTDIAPCFGQAFAHGFTALGASWYVGGSLLLVAGFEAPDGDRCGWRDAKGSDVGQRHPA